LTIFLNILHFREGDRSGNCPAGFIANEGIKSPSAMDFYLQSHGGLLGSKLDSHLAKFEVVHTRKNLASRPSHYITLLDENFNNDSKR